MASYDALKRALNKGSVGSMLNSAGGGGQKKRTGGFYSEKWSPPHRTDDKKPPAEPIALIKGEHTIKAKTADGEPIDFEFPFWIYYDHYNASKGIKRRSCACSAGLVVDLDESGQPRFSHGSEPCIPCHYIDEEGADDYMNRSRKVVFTAIVLKWFHLKQEGKSTTFEPCSGKHCELCSQGVPKQFGRRVFWPMGPIWANYLFQKSATLASSCACSGEIEYLGFSCPECNAILVDFDKRPPKPGEIEMYREVVECPQCAEEVLPNAEVECSDCGDPRLVDLWSVAIKPIRIGENYTPDLEGWRALKPKEIDALSSYKPIDFAKFLSPSSLKDQSKWFGLKNPFNKKADESGADEWD